jgi:hypothetical protein
MASAETKVFSTATRQGVTGVLKATGSTDPDVLFAAKQDLVDAYKPAKTMSWIPLICGVVLTVTVIGAFIGIPALILGWWMRRKGTRNLATVEAAYDEYLASIGLKPIAPGVAA